MDNNFRKPPIIILELRLSNPSKRASGVVPSSHPGRFIYETSTVSDRRAPVNNAPMHPAIDRNGIITEHERMADRVESNPCKYLTEKHAINIRRPSLIAGSEFLASILVTRLPK